MHTVCALVPPAEVKAMVLLGRTVTMPGAEPVLLPPVKFTT